MRALVEAPIPRKHVTCAAAAYAAALRDFFADVLDAFLTHVDFSLVQCVVIAGPGFTKTQFRDYIFLQAGRRAIMENVKARIVLVPASSGYQHSLQGVLDSTTVKALIKNTRASQEVLALQEFLTMIAMDSDRACYGPKIGRAHV